MHRKSHRQEQYPFCEDPAQYQRCLVLETLHMMHQTTLDCRAMPVVVYSKMPRRLFLSICVLPYVSSSSPFSIDLGRHSLRQSSYPHRRHTSRIATKAVPIQIKS